MNERLLIVDDEQKVIDILQPFLEGEKFKVDTATTGTEALRKAAEFKPELVLLDWMLPELSGIDVCRELRKASNVAIIMLTARTEETDRIIGLELGADDYVTKPFSLRELLARIRSVLRRLNPQTDEAELLQRGDLVIDEASFRVFKRDEEIVLTPAEFQILVTLANRPGVVYSRLQLLKATMGDEYLYYERTIDSHISHLRKKIEDDPSAPDYIQTVHGVGYRFGNPK
ncbi:response regulator transcription factor [Alicyclobacillus sp. SO9]|uniref:response regulator transcription factor n=1 Tax=Alicyclobacillus sp. SO9 TaxID=2665646 RepID=UPI0018E7CB8B|nr:response regulator transcription factor [Alicyclobacillus sp. SO9]QQE77817.1 response regulator transcription factor [Alicyclobacillus sp. SO9]